MKKKIAIKKAVPEDAGVVYDITQEAFKKYAQDLELPQAVDALRDTEADILRDIREKTVLIACLDGQPAGAVRFDVIGDVARITRFGVKLMAQGRGVGSALIGAVETMCREMGLTAILLHTSARMFPLVRFYYGQGFFIHSTTTDRGYIRALMVLELNGEIDVDYAKYLG